MNNLYNWTDQEDQVLRNNYNKMQMKEIHKLLPHRTFAALKHRRKVLGLKKREYTSVNETFFETPNLQNCMVAGWIAADGCVTSNNRFCTYISYKDYDFLVKIKELMGYIGKIYINTKTRIGPIGKNKRNKENYTFTGKYCGFSTWNTIKWCEDLKKNWNIVPRKTLILQPPNITELDHILAFISGNIDGDGMITKSKNIKYNFPFRLSINLLGTEPFLKWIKIQFDNITPFDTESRIYRRDNIYTYNITGTRAYILAKMMLSLNILRLDRKWNIAREYINLVENTELSVEMASKLKRMVTPEIIEFLKSKGQTIPDYNQKYQEAILRKLDNNDIKKETKENILHPDSNCKVCNRCKQLKNINDFYSFNYRDNIKYRGICKICRKESEKLKNRKKILENLTITNDNKDDIMKRKQKLQQQELDLEQRKYKNINLNQLMGDGGGTRFGTLDEDEFVKKLDDISTSETDLQDFAIKHGLRPTDNVRELKRKLLDAFREHVRTFRVEDKPVQPIKDTPELRKLMADGR